MGDAVCLASGGLDSTVCLALVKKSGYRPIPLFVDYGQINRDMEFSALKSAAQYLGLEDPIVLDFHDFGRVVRSGLTQASLDVVQDAFTPCRNLLFIVAAAAVANTRGLTTLVLGLLDEATIIFPDQSDAFIAAAEHAISNALGVKMDIVLPLRDFRKSDVVRLSRELGVTSSYSCHAGTVPPCGVCIACKEYDGDL